MNSSSATMSSSIAIGKYAPVTYRRPEQEKMIAPSITMPNDKSVAKFNGEPVRPSMVAAASKNCKFNKASVHNRAAMFETVFKPKKAEGVTVKKGWKSDRESMHGWKPVSAHFSALPPKRSLAELP